MQDFGEKRKKKFQIFLSKIKHYAKWTLNETEKSFHKTFEGKGYASGVHYICCLESYIEGHWIYQLSSLAKRPNQDQFG